MRWSPALLTLALLVACGSPPARQDAGSGDAGRTDGGVDADTLDAGTLDAGEPDAGDVDAGEPDAGDPDAGAADAGASDAGAPLVTPVGTWTWVPVPGSECASGATAGLGINRAASDDDLFLFLQGGGACWNQGTCVPSLLQFGPVCDYGTVCLLDVPGGQKPTAVYVTHPDPFPADGGGAFPTELAGIARSAALDRTRADNPFKDATFVFVPYCTGDLHGGRAEKTFQYKYGLFDPTSTYRVHFSGAKNMDAYLAKLRVTFPAESACGSRA
jgi:hypothetical protein